LQMFVHFIWNKTDMLLNQKHLQQEVHLTLNLTTVAW